MARSLFGGTEDDWGTSVWKFGKRLIPAFAVSTAITLWDAPVDGNQITDLTADAAGTLPLGTLSTDESGYYPAFYGPDGVTALWGQLEGSSRRFLMLTTDTATIAAAADRAEAAQTAAEAAAASISLGVPGGAATLDGDGLLVDAQVPTRLAAAQLAVDFVPQSTQGVYIGSKRYADLPSALMAAVAAGGFSRIELLGDVTLDEPLYVNSTGDEFGDLLNGMTFAGGGRGPATIHAETLPYALSFGKRAIASNSQASGVSNGIVVENLDLVGAGVEFWGCQRASQIRNVRVDLTGATAATRGIYAVYSSTLQLLQTRVDNGGDNVDGIILDTCSDAVILGGGANYCRSGLTVQAALVNSQRSTSLNVLGFHTEGDRLDHYRLDAVGNAVITPHIVTSEHWDTAYPLIRLGGDPAYSAINVRINGGYVTGSGGGGAAGIAVLADHADHCVIDGTRFANVLNGIVQTANASGLEMRRPNFEASVLNPFVNNGTAEAILPGTVLVPTCSQGGNTLAAGQTVSLTLGGVNSASATRIPVMRPGSVVGIGLRIGSTLTAGSLTVKVQRNGVDIADCALVKGVGGSGTAAVRFAPGKFAMTGADDLRVQVTTSADYATGAAVVPVVVVEYLPG